MEKILVVEDDADIQEVLKNYLMNCKDYPATNKDSERRPF